ncbi:unnamed protein product, partial [Ectocarpus sp. 12 AP-2014]
RGAGVHKTTTLTSGACGRPFLLGGIAAAEPQSIKALRSLPPPKASRVKRLRVGYRRKGSKETSEK